jgi:uncharacterized SAM-binding protein YcdF (DUF218 family)
VFYASKLLTALTQPVTWLALWWLAALLLPTRRRGLSRAMLWLGLAFLGLLGFEAAPDALIRRLEAGQQALGPVVASRHVGVIVLGGATGHPTTFRAHGEVPLNAAAERMTASVALMREHPRMRLVYSGGEGRLLATGTPEAELARAFYRGQGLDLSRMRFEGLSRSTRENAREVRAALGEACGGYLLVTSAWHMPRALKEFRSVGCAVTPYPVDFRTGASTSLTEYSLVRSLELWQLALHELVGGLAYDLTR